MLGLIVRAPSVVDSRKSRAAFRRDGKIYGFNGSIYYFTEADYEKLEFHIGDEVEFSEKNTADSHQRRFFRTYVTVNRITESKQSHVADGIAIYRDKSPRDIRVLKTVKSYRAYGEASTQEEALRLLAKTVKSIGGNAAVLLKLNIVISRVSHKPFFICSAVPALAQTSGAAQRAANSNPDAPEKSPPVSPEESSGIPADPDSFSFSISKSMVKNFSPNHAFLWYAKTAVLVTLLIVVPFIIEESFDRHSLKWLATAIIVLSLGSAVLFYLSPCFSVGYLRRQPQKFREHEEQ